MLQLLSSSCFGRFMLLSCARESCARFCDDLLEDSLSPVPKRKQPQQTADNNDKVCYALDYMARKLAGPIIVVEQGNNSQDNPVESMVSANKQRMNLRTASLATIVADT